MIVVSDGRRMFNIRWDSRRHWRDEAGHVWKVSYDGMKLTSEHHGTFLDWSTKEGGLNQWNGKGKRHDRN